MLIQSNTSFISQLNFHVAKLGESLNIRLHKIPSKKTSVITVANILEVISMHGMKIEAQRIANQDTYFGHKGVRGVF